VTCLDDILADGALTRVLRSFKEATGIAARIVKATGAPAIASRTWEDCAFCRLVRSSEEGRNRCSMSYAYAARQAAYLGDLYVFQCHAGLVCWAAPLVSDGTLLGAVICGQVIMWEPDEYLIRDSVERLRDLDIPLPQLEAAITQLEQVTTRRVQAAAELLFAVSTYIVRSEDLALEQRNEIYRQQRLLGEAIQERKRIEEQFSIRGLYSPQQERELLSAVRSGQRTEAKRMLNEILADIFLSQPDRPDIIKARLLELAVFLARAAVEAGADPERILGLNYQSIGDLSRCETFEEVCFWIVRVMDEFMDAVQDTPDLPSGQVQEAIRFMQSNLASKLSLADIASSVHISPSHLSHLFKEETGMSVMDCLTALRISEAKHLLAMPQLTVAQVSAAVGFQDPAHFSRSFKRMEGISPTAYRQSMISAG